MSKKFPRIIPPGQYFRGRKEREQWGGRQADRHQTLTNTRIEKTWNYQYHQYHQHKMFAFPVHTVFLLSLSLSASFLQKVHDIYLYTSSLRQRTRLRTSSSIRADLLMCYKMLPKFVDIHKEDFFTLDKYSKSSRQFALIDAQF